MGGAETAFRSNTFKSAMLLLTGAVLSALAPSGLAATGTWNVDANGNWSDTANWASGTVADGGVGNNANFTNDISATRTVSVDVDRTIGVLFFSDNGASGSSWIVSGPGVLTAAAASVSTPTTISAQISPSAAFQVNGANNATLTLSGTNTYTGMTRLSSNAILRATDGVGLPATSNLNFFAPTPLAVLESNGIFTRKTGSGAGQLSWNLGAAGGFSAYGGTFVIQLTNSSNVANGALVWGSGGFMSSVSPTFSLNSPTADSLVDFQNPIALGSSNRTFVVFDNLNLTTDRARLSGTLTSTGGGLTKNGSGIFELTASNTYTGNTVVNAGTLLANNTSGSATGFGSVSVNGTATLGGTGFIVTNNQPITFASGTKLSPGASAGTLTTDTGLAAVNITGAITASNSQSLVFELNTPSTSDQLKLVGGTLDIGSGLLEFDDFNFTTLGGFGAGDYMLFDGVNPISGTLGTNLTGTLDGLNAVLSLSDNNHDLLLTVSAAVPEPGSLSFLALGGAALLHRRRRHA